MCRERKAAFTSEVGLSIRNPASWLRALHHALRPQAAAAGREDIAEAILLVGDRQVAAAAEGAGREGEAVHTLAIGDIFRVEPADRPRCARGHCR